MAAVWLWVRRDGRRRIRTLSVLAILVALSAGVVLAATTGARRNGSAYARLSARSRPATLMALPNSRGFDWDAVRRLPDVESVGEFAVAWFDVEGYPFGTGFLPAVGRELRTSIERGVLVDGRYADQSRADEVMVTPSSARQLHLRLGDHLRLGTWRADKIEQYMQRGSPPPPDGPTIDATIVGITKAPFDVAGLLEGQVITTSAFYARYHENLVSYGGFVNALVRLRDGDNGVARFGAALDRQAGHPVEITRAATGAKRVTNATSLERGALLAFALAAALAALVLIGQALVRLVAAAGVEMRTLASMGMTPRQQVLALAAPPLVAGVIGALASVGIAYAASSRFPIGVGGGVEPDPGLHADWLVLGAGLALLVLVYGLCVAGAAWWYVKWGGQAPPRRASRLARVMRATGAPVPVAFGAQLALNRGQGRSGVPVRPALIGAIVGVLGIVGALTFRAGLDHATSDRALFGQQFDAFATLFPTEPVPPDAIRAIIADPDVDVLNDTYIGVVELARHDVTVFGADALKGHLAIVTTTGRAPRASDEIVLSPQDRAALRVGVGDTVSAANGSSYRVVGIGFTPQDSHTAYDQGAWMTEAGLRRAVPRAEDLKYRRFFAGFRAGVAPDAALTRLNHQADGAFEPTQIPADLQNLKGVRRVPLALGTFLVLLAIAAVGHALASAVRHRRRDLGVLRAIGMTRGQARATVAWQATTLALVGVVVGVPLGLVLGRYVWHVVADATPLRYVAPVAGVVLVLVAPLALVLANVLAAWPARTASRLRPAEALRTE